MVSFEITFIDIILVIAITILITLYVTLLIRLKPTTKTTIGEYDKNQQKIQVTSPQTPLKAFEDHRPSIQTSKPITIAEAIQMRQTSTAIIETVKEHEVPKTAKTPKSPMVYIENHKDIEHEQEVSKTSEKREAPKTEERKPPTPPPIQTSTGHPMSVDMGLPKGSPECAHYFGYLRTLPKNTPIPDECFGCTRIMECFMQT